MKLSLAQKITILNKTVLECFGASTNKYIVKKFVDAGIQVLGADFGCSWLKQGSNNFILAYKSPTMPYTPKPPRRNDGVNARIQRAKVPLLIHDIWPNPKVKSDSKSYMRAIAGVPIVYKRHNYGNLIYCFKKPHSFTEEEQIICEYIGNTTAQAITINQLYASVTEFKKTLDHARDPILLLNPIDLSVLYANQPVMKHLGMPEKKLLGASVRELPTGIPLDNFQTTIQEVINQPRERRVFETDIILKEQDPIPVEVSVEHVVTTTKEPRLLVTLRNLTDLRKAQSEVKRSVYYDKLTGLPNRMFLMEELPKVIEQAKADKRQFALLFVDLDKFKFINDMLGHEQGDVLLVEVAKRLWNSLDKRDMVVRMSSDEFVILLDHIKSIQDVEEVAEHIQTAFQEPFTVEQQEVYTNMSVGISVFPTDGTTIRTLLQNAEAALRWVKEAGGGAFRHYYADIATTSPERLKLEQQLRHAARKGQLSLHYAPCARTIAHTLLFARALLRWEHPEQGVIALRGLLDRSEESAVAIEVGYWQIREAVRQIKEWRTKGLGDVAVSVGISRRQLIQQHFIQTVRDILTAGEVAPSLVIFELSERMVMQNAQQLAGILAELKQMGVRLVIDSFGRGYTSLNFLKRLPIEIIKIDSQFIQGIGANRHDKALVSAMISLAHDMDMVVVAEGVTTKQQVSFLTQRGCDALEGPWLGEPLSPQEFTHIIAQKFTLTSKPVH